MEEIVSFISFLNARIVLFEQGHSHGVARDNSFENGGSEDGGSDRISSMSETVLKADPRWQRWVLLIAALGGALSVRFIYELDRTLGEIAEVAVLNPGRAAEMTVQVSRNVLLGMSVVLGLIALYLIIQGVRITLTEQHPLPGARVVMDTKVRFGDAARRRALLGFTLAALLVVTAIWLPRLGLHYISQAIVIPEPQEMPQLIDPDAFPQAVPGPHLVDPRDPRNPLAAGKGQRRNGSQPAEKNDPERP